MPARSLPSPRRYAQAVFQLALEMGTVEAWLQDLQDMAHLVRSPEVVALLQAPGARPEERLRAIRQALPEAGGLAHNLLALLARLQALALLPRILQEFQGLVDAYQGVQAVEAFSAIPLGPGEEERLREHLEEVLGKRVRFTVRVDPNLLGGLIIKVGDHWMDGSLRGRLQALHEALAEAVP